jgi:hypothetical protein
MNLRRLAARTAVVGLSTTLAVGALVSSGTVAANAAGGSGNYSCSVPGSPQPLPVTVTIDADLAGIPALPSGFAVAAGTLPIPVKFTIPAAVIASLGTAPIPNVHQIGISAVDFALPWGDTKIPLTGLTQPKTATPATGDMVFSSPTATHSDFRLPGAGANLPVTMPSSFTMTAVTDSAIVSTMVLTCTTATPTTLANLTVVKQGSMIGKIKAPKSVKAKKKFSIVANVAGGNVPATGNVVAKEGKKVLGKGALKNGKATIVLKKGIKKVGKHTITVSYAGDKNTNAASNPSTVSVKVKAAKKK